MTENSSKAVFVSHAATDKAIAEKVVDLLNSAMNIDVQKMVFCTSLEGLKIPPGMDFKQFIKEQIQTPQIVILLISQNYLASPFCLAEAGASWAMSHRVIPILVPPATFGDMKAILAGLHALEVTSPSDWNEALSVFKEVFGLDPNVNRWERKRNEKIGEIVALLPTQLLPPIVPLQRFEEIEAKLEAANEEIRELEDQKSQLEVLLMQVKSAKDATDVARIELESLPSAKAFDVLVSAARAEVREFKSEAMREAFFYHLRNQSLPPLSFADPGREERWDEIQRAVEYGYCVENSDGSVDLNQANPAVRKAVSALCDLRKFVSEASDLAEPYEEEHGHQFDFSLRSFWESNLWS